MKLKDEVLKLLEENRGKSISGSIIAEQLFCTRSAVWKAIKSLEAQGYEIEAVTNKGYCLKETNDIISVNALLPHLTGPAAKFQFDIRETVTSTNLLLKEAAANGAPSGLIMIAKEQTEGKGRMGRSFYSPASTGIYLSLLLRPNVNADQTLLLTTSAAVAVCRAIEKVSRAVAKIKWVNDIYMNDKKVCGILSEASMNCETGQIDYVVIGIGLNVTTKKFPKELEGKAGSIYQNQSDSSNNPQPQKTPVLIRLITSLLNELGEFSCHFSDPSYLKEYKERSMLLGKEIG